MTSTELRGRIAAIADRSMAQTHLLAKAVLDLIDWVEGGSPDCDHDGQWYYAQSFQHWRCGRCGAMSHAAPKGQKPEEVVSRIATLTAVIETVITEVLITPSMKSNGSDRLWPPPPFPNTVEPFVFEPGDVLRLVRVRKQADPGG